MNSVAITNHTGRANTRMFANNSRIGIIRVIPSKINLCDTIEKIIAGKGQEISYYLINKMFKEKSTLECIEVLYEFMTKKVNVLFVSTSETLNKNDNPDNIFEMYIQSTQIYNKYCDSLYKIYNLHCPESTVTRINVSNDENLLSMCRKNICGDDIHIFMNKRKTNYFSLFRDMIFFRGYCFHFLDILYQALYEMSDRRNVVNEHNIIQILELRRSWNKYANIKDFTIMNRYIDRFNIILNKFLDNSQSINVVCRRMNKLFYVVQNAVGIEEDTEKKKEIYELNELANILVSFCQTYTVIPHYMKYLRSRLLDPAYTLYSLDKSILKKMQTYFGKTWIGTMRVMISDAIYSSKISDIIKNSVFTLDEYSDVKTIPSVIPQLLSPVPWRNKDRAVLNINIPREIDMSLTMVRKISETQKNKHHITWALDMGYAEIKYRGAVITCTILQAAVLLTFNKHIKLTPDTLSTELNITLALSNILLNSLYACDILNIISTDKKIYGATNDIIRKNINAVDAFMSQFEVTVNINK
jgi:hypothetical protein